MFQSNNIFYMKAVDIEFPVPRPLIKWKLLIPVDFSLKSLNLHLTEFCLIHRPSAEVSQTMTVYINIPIKD